MAAKARTKRGEKTQAVRDYLTNNPDASARDVAAALKQQGITVSETYIYNIKSRTGKPKRKGSRRKAKGNTNGAAATRSTTGASPVDSQSMDALFAAKEFADKLGGIGKAKAVLDVLARLR
jgi:hypothetical protein